MMGRHPLDDTDPTGPPVDTADTDPGDVTDSDATSPSDDLQSEVDADDLLRWLPTLGNRHRRRTELVERPTSGGADFAAYACEARPAAASARRRPEAKVLVRTDRDPRTGSRARGASDETLEASERDAPTVVKERRRFPSRRALVGLGAAGFLAVSAPILWFAGGRRGAEVPARTTAAAAVPSPPPTAQTFAERLAPSPPLPPPAGLPGDPQAASTPVAPAAQRTAALAPLVKASKAARRKGERTLAPVAGSGRAAASTAAPPVPIKEQFFEDP
jgi:hypothetical protein